MGLTLRNSCFIPEALRKKNLGKDLALQKQPLPDVYKKGIRDVLF